MKPSVSRTIEKPDSPFMYKIKKQYEYVIPTNSNSPNRTIGMASENRQFQTIQPLKTTKDTNKTSLLPANQTILSPMKEEPPVSALPASRDNSPTNINPLDDINWNSQCSWDSDREKVMTGGQRCRFMVEEAGEVVEAVPKKKSIWAVGAFPQQIPKQKKEQRIRDGMKKEAVLQKKMQKSKSTASIVTKASLADRKLHKSSSTL